MGRSHRWMSSLKLSASPPTDLATSSSSVHAMRRAEGPSSGRFRRCRDTDGRAARATAAIIGRRLAGHMTYNADLARPPRASVLRTSARKARTGRTVRRSGRAASAKTAGAASAVSLPLATLLAHATNLAEVLPHLHRDAVSAAGGT